MFLFVLIASVIAALVPAWVYMGLLRWLDRFADEPLPFAWTAFLWGAFPAALIAMIAEGVIDPTTVTWDRQSAELFGAAGVAPVVEEIAKGVIVYAIFIFARIEFSSPLRGIIYGALAGCGFAVTENVLYFLVGYYEGGVGAWTGLVIVRAIIFGVNHSLFTGLTGLGLGLATVNAPWIARALFAIAGLGAGMMYHAIHNAGATLLSNDLLAFGVSMGTEWGGVLLMVLVVWLGIAYEKTWVALELTEELNAGMIDTRDFALARSHRTRFFRWLGAWLTFNPRRAARISHLAELLTELAYRKRQIRMRGDDYSSQIHDLRQTIVMLRAIK